MDDEEYYLNDENDPAHVTKIENEETTLEQDERVKEEDEKVGEPKLTITNLKEHDVERTNMLIRSIKEGKLK